VTTTTGASGGGGSSTTTSGPPQTQLAAGEYINGPDGTAHYVFSVGNSGTGGIQGSITYLYQNEITDTVANYTGTISGTTLSLSLSTGPSLSGTVQSQAFNLSNCAAVLNKPAPAQSCNFTYNGHTP
jgi:hypothetical protein